MESGSTNALTLTETSVEELRDIFGDLPAKDKIYYDHSPRKQWFLFGKEPYVGHASLVPLGAKLPTNSYRGGGFWMHPDHRSKGVGIHYACDIFKYAMTLMPGPVYKIYGRTYTNTRLLEHYVKIGWQLGKEFKGGFIDMFKYLFYKDGEHFQYIGNEVKISKGIMTIGDWSYPMPKVILK